MAKGRGHNRKKEARRQRDERRSSAGMLPTITQGAPLTPASSGVKAAQGPVSAAYRSWAADYGRRQAQAVAEQYGPPDGEPLPPDLFVLAPLTTRTVQAANGDTVSIQVGLPIVATRNGAIALAPDRLAVAAVRLREPDAQGAMAMLGLGQAPDLPPPEPLFAVQLPAEGMRGVRPADAMAWYLARAVEAGDVTPEPRAIGEAAGEALALLRPAIAPRGVPRLDPALLDAYAGYGADADEEAVPPDITAAPARGGLPGLPGGAYLEDNGAPLAPLLADLRDYVVGLWPYEYFDLEGLTADPEATDDAGRPARLAALAGMIRRLDEVLAQTAESEEAMLAAEGRPPAWIAGETAHYREARQALRSTRVAQEMLPLLGPILFDLEIPPADYAPADAEMEEDE